MKKVALVLITFIILLSNKKPDSKLIHDLGEAVELGLVEIKIDGRHESPHYAQPAHLSIRNLTDKAVNVRIPNGQQLVSNPSTVQDLIVVNEELLILAAKETKEKDLYAMCTQHQNTGPTRSTVYSLGGVASGPLKRLTKEIQKRRDYNTLGQYSVWSIANKRDISTIAGYDEAAATHYQKLVADLTGRPLPVKDTTDYLTNYNNASLVERSIGGRFEYGFSKTSAVTIGLFNEQNIIVRELFNHPEMKPGDHELDFTFDAMAYTDPIYYVRLIIDGNIKINFEVEMEG